MLGAVTLPGRKAAKVFQKQGLGSDLGVGVTRKVLSTLGVELQSLEEAVVMVGDRHDFLPYSFYCSQFAGVVLSSEGTFEGW